MKNSEIFSSFTDEIICHVLSFFLEPRKPQNKVSYVDDKTLRSLLLVSKRIKSILESPNLWREWANFRDIGQSLDLVDQYVYCHSMIGFKKIRILDTVEPNTGTVRYQYIAQERSSGQLFEVTIEDDEVDFHRVTMRSDLLKELFVGHFLYAEHFLQPSRQGHQIRVPVKISRGAYITRKSSQPTCRVTTLRWGFCESLPENFPSDNRHGYRVLFQWCHSIHPETDNLRHLLQLEARVMSVMDPTRVHMQAEHWAKIIDWLIEIADVFDLENAPYFRAALYLDQLLSQVDSYARPRFYQRIAGGCLYIAANLGSRGLRAQDIALSADNTFSAAETLKYADVALEMCAYRLARPTLLDFVRQYATVIGIPEDNSSRLSMILYVSELALHTDCYLTNKPSMIAACVLVLALYCFDDQDVWPEILVGKSNYQWDQLEDCLLQLSANIERIQHTLPELYAARQKFSLERYHRVSSVQIPLVDSFAALTKHREKFKRETRY